MAKHPKRNTTNEDEFLTEYYQLQAVVEKLQETGFISNLSDKEIEEIKQKKINKVNYYFERS